MSVNDTVHSPVNVYSLRHEKLCWFNSSAFVVHLYKTVLQ